MRDILDTHTFRDRRRHTKGCSLTSLSITRADNPYITDRIILVAHLINLSDSDENENIRCVSQPSQLVEVFWILNDVVHKRGSEPLLY